VEEGRSLPRKCYGRSRKKKNWRWQCNNRSDTGQSQEVGPSRAGTLRGKINEEGFLVGSLAPNTIVRSPTLPKAAWYPGGASNPNMLRSIMKVRVNKEI
jgi:hypothetical protein